MNYEIGKYIISSFCYGTYPCKHYVTNEKKTEMMYGDDIYCMLRLNGLHHEHFDIYKNTDNETNKDEYEHHYRTLIEAQQKQQDDQEYKKPKVSTKMKAYLERLYSKK